MSDMFQYLVIGAIVLSVLWHVFRGGAANPESTGSLGKKANALSSDVSALSDRVRHLETDMKTVKREGATTKDIEQLREATTNNIGGLRQLIETKLESQKEISEATSRNVQRIYDIMLERGLNGK